MTSQPKERLADRGALQRGVDDLRAIRKYSDAVPLAERLVAAIEAERGGDTLDLVSALINLAELLIAANRLTEAEKVLQRALAIISRDPDGATALHERSSHITTGNLVNSVPALRDLVGYTYDLRHARQPPRQRRASLEPFSPRKVSPEEAQAAIAELQQIRGTRAIASQAALEVEAGRLAYQIPEGMWVGVQETVEVRLGAVIANEIMQDFVGRGDVKLEHVPIVETMSVSLESQPSKFEIVPRSKEVQLVKPDLVKGTAFHQDDFARWIWLVTPRQRGKHTLLVKVSAAIRDSRGLPTTSSLPDKIIAVTVQVHLARAAVGVIRYIAPLVLSGVVTALVGVFTKDYWWPAVRTWLGW
jgi:hypothetical protein